MDQQDRDDEQPQRDVDVEQPPEPQIEAETEHPREASRERRECQYGQQDRGPDAGRPSADAVADAPEFQRDEADERHADDAVDDVDPRGAWRGREHARDPRRQQDDDRNENPQVDHPGGRRHGVESSH